MGTWSGEGLRRSDLDGKRAVRIGPGWFRVRGRKACRGNPPEGTGEIFLPAQENAPVRFKDGQREDNPTHGFRGLTRSRSPEGSAGSRLTENVFPAVPSRRESTARRYPEKGCDGSLRRAVRDKPPGRKRPVSQQPKPIQGGPPMR